MSKEVNKYIAEKRRKKKIKNTILILIALFCITILFVFKSTFFNIKSVNIEGNSIIKSESLDKEVEYLKGTNILTVNTESIVDALKKNSYIESVSIKKEFPSKLKINVTEREAKFYFIENDKKYIINYEFVILEEKSSIDDMNLVEIKNINGNTTNVGEKAIEDDRKSKILKNIHDILNKNKSEIEFKAIDINDLTDIKFYSKDVEVKVGNDEDIKGKLNKAINILKDKNVNITKGIIDVRYNSNPSIIKEEEKNNNQDTKKTNNVSNENNLNKKPQSNT